MTVTRNGAAIDFGVLLAPVIRARGMLLVFVLLGAALGIAHFLLATAEYEAKVVILPDINSGTSLLNGANELAMMAGIRLGGDSEPTLYYRDILLSDLILDRVLQETNSTGRTVQTALGYGDDLEAKEKAVRRLRKLISVSRDNRNGIVKLAVRSGEVELSRGIADNLVAALDRFLKNSQARSAESQFDFLSREIERADGSLDEAEKSLAAFKVRNRMIVQSPELQREQSRLQRELVIRETVMIELRKQAEILKISANEQVSKIQIIEPARAYRKAVYPVLYQSLLVGILLLALLALAVIYGRAYLWPAITRQLADA